MNYKAYKMYTDASAVIPPLPLDELLNWLYDNAVDWKLRPFYDYSLSCINRAFGYELSVLWYEDDDWEFYTLEKSGG